MSKVLAEVILKNIQKQNAETISKKLKENSTPFSYGPTPPTTEASLFWQTMEEENNALVVSHIYLDNSRTTFLKLIAPMK